MEQRNPMEIGLVTSVSGSRVSGIMAVHQNQNKNAAVLGASQVAGLVPMATPRSLVFGIIGGLDSVDPSYPARPDGKRTMRIDLMGETLLKDQDGQLVFQRGVSLHPPLGAPILTTTSKTLSQI